MKSIFNNLHNESKNDLLLCGVYTIELKNKPGIYYIGSTTANFSKRWKRHFYEFRTDKYFNRKLHNNITKYGIENVIFKILDICDKTIARSIEQYWITIIDSVNCGYNMHKTVIKPFGYKHSITTKEKLRLGKLGIKNPNFGKKRTQYEIDNLKIFTMKPILQYDLDGNLIKEFESIAAASSSINKRTENISKATRSKTKIAYGYRWLMKNDIISDIKTISILYKHKIKYYNYDKMCKDSILQIDIITGNILNTFDNCINASKNVGVDSSNISRALREETITCNNNFWLYSKYYSKEKIYELQQKFYNKYKINRKPFNKDLKKTKHIIQFSLDGQYIKNWNSIKEAAENLNIQTSGIIRCCKGEMQSSGNYIWKYA